MTWSFGKSRASYFSVGVGWGERVGVREIVELIIRSKLKICSKSHDLNLQCNIILIFGYPFGRGHMTLPETEYDQVGLQKF